MKKLFIPLLIVAAFIVRFGMTGKAEAEEPKVSPRKSARTACRVLHGIPFAVTGCKATRKVGRRSQLNLSVIVELDNVSLMPHVHIEVIGK